MNWEHNLEKNSIQKIEENAKIQSENTACEQKTTRYKANFCSNTVFSLYFIIRLKKRASLLVSCSIHLSFGLSLIESLRRNLQRFRLFDPDCNIHVCHCFPLTTQGHPAEDFCPLWSAISFDYSTLSSTLCGICPR